MYIIGAMLVVLLFLTTIMVSRFSQDDDRMIDRSLMLKPLSFLT